MKMNIFNSIQLKKQKSNTFDLTHDVKFSAKMGNLTPVLCTEVVPGDSFQIGADSLIRFAPLIAPVMHRFDTTIHYFFVPNRLLWNDWEDFITGNLEVVAPYMQDFSAISDAAKKHCDYMGVPVDGMAVDVKINALPFAAFQCIYNEYYRDQNLIEAVDFKLTSGEVTGLKKSTLLTPRLRAWMHDYFTASLPFAQKGPSVDIPLGDVRLKELEDITIPPLLRNQSNLAVDPTVQALGQQAIGPTPTVVDTDNNNPILYDPGDTLESGTTTINNLRIAMRLQMWLEKNARAGTRYIENILAHFGVRSSDKRLQRPEYITGVKTPIVISEVLNTTGEDGGLPQGNMSGHAVSVGMGHSGSYYAEEHGFIIGIMSVMPRPAYQDLVNKQFLKLDKFDYYWPDFAHLGEQEVKNIELYNKSATPDGIFGYVPRYSEYKYIPSRVAGDFRATLDYWHLARQFASQPELTQEFIECNPADLTRIFAVEDDNFDNLYCHVLHKIKARRLMPTFGTPML